MLSVPSEVSQAVVDAGSALVRAPVSRVTIENPRLSFDLDGAVNAVSDGNMEAFDICRYGDTFVALKRLAGGSLLVSRHSVGQITDTLSADWRTVETSAAPFSDVAIAAVSEAIYRAFWFQADGLYAGDINWSGSEVQVTKVRVATVTAPGWLHCGTVGSDYVAFAKPFNGVYGDLVLLTYSGGSWHEHVWDLRQKLDFNARDLRVECVKIGNRYRVVYCSDRAGEDVDIHAVWFEDGVWSQSTCILPLDTEGDSSFFKAPFLSVVNGRVWLFYAWRQPFHTGGTDAVTALACIHSLDGENWSEVDVLVDSSQDILGGHLLAAGDLTLLLGHDIANGHVTRWISKGVAMTGNRHADHILDLSDYVNGWKLELPAEAAAHGSIELSNRDGAFVNVTKNRDLLSGLAQVTYEGGYRVNGSPGYALLGTHDLYVPEHNTALGTDDIKLSTYDRSNRLDLWRANREHLFESQVRQFDNLRDAQNTLGWRGVWEKSGNGLHGRLALGDTGSYTVTGRFAMVYGAATIDGEAAPVGTEVLAFNGQGEIVGVTVVTIAGEYPIMNLYGVEGERVGARDGEAIRFMVGNYGVSATWTFQASDTAMVEVNLAGASGAAVPESRITLKRATAAIPAGKFAAGSIRFQMRFGGDQPTGYAGCALCLSDDERSKERAYIVAHSIASGKLELYKEIDGNWGSALTSCTPAGYAGNGWLWLSAELWYGTLRVLYSLDGVTWTVAFSYADSDPLEPGYAAFEQRSTLPDGAWFADLTVTSAEKDWQLEEIVRSLACRVGIDALSLSSLLADGFTGLSTDTWPESRAGSTWAAAGGKLTAVGSAAATDYGLRSAAEAGDFICTGLFTPGSGGECGVIMNADAGLTRYYLISLTAAHARLYQRSGGVTRLLFDVPMVHNITGECRVSLSRQDKYVGLWVNERFVFGCYTPTGAEATNFVGLAVVGNQTVAFDDIRIAELDDYVEAHAVAIGQTASQAFEELLGKRHIRWFLRGNGELKAGRFADRDESAAITYRDTMIDAVKTPNHTEWFSHVQVVGAADLADKVDLDTMARKGYRFVKVDNPDVMTPRDCYQEASTIQVESEEVSDVREFTACAQVRQERQDLVRIVNALDGTDAIFTAVGLSFEFAIAEDAVAFDMRLQGTLALERIRREIQRDRRKNFLSGRIVGIHKVTRAVDIQEDGSPTWVRNISIPLTINMDDLKIGDMVLVALVNGVYFVLNAYSGTSRSEPYRYWWYSETLPSPVEFKWESDACTSNNLICYWG